ncbi:MAG: rhamnose ABC transporter substrate-binding protein, partial [Lysobacteraceae bacterium]
MKIKKILLAAAAVGILAGLAGCGEKKANPADPAAPQQTKIAMVVKSLGNGFFDAAHT